MKSTSASACAEYMRKCLDKKLFKKKNEKLIWPPVRTETMIGGGKLIHGKATNRHTGDAPTTMWLCKHYIFHNTKNTKLKARTRERKRSQTKRRQ